MKTYLTLTKLTSDERNAELVMSFHRAVVLTDEKKILQKNVAKQLVAMVSCGDCESGKLRSHAMKITGKDIRETLQDIYGLVNVFQAVIDGDIEITEEEYDTLDQAKLALLSPFIGPDAKPELKEKLAEAVQAVKTGTAKDIRNLKPKRDKEAATEADKPGATLAVGFLATDILATEPLVKSRQFKARLNADFANAMETGDEESLLAMLELFGKAYIAACQSLGENAVEMLQAFTAQDATEVAATVIETLETPALECAVA